MENDSRNKDFSEPKPFERTVSTKKQYWWLTEYFKTKGLFFGITLIIVGSCVLYWYENQRYFSLFFFIPGIYRTIQSLSKKKTDESAKINDIIDD